MSPTTDIGPCRAVESLTHGVSLPSGPAWNADLPTHLQRPHEYQCVTRHADVKGQMPCSRYFPSMGRGSIPWI